MYCSFSKVALHAYIVGEDRHPDITLVRIVQYDLTQVNVDRFRLHHAYAWRSLPAFLYFIVSLLVDCIMNPVTRLSSTPFGGTD
jgi:hypothetical protein